jgi:hypothetical protein
VPLFEGNGDLDILLESGWLPAVMSGRLPLQSLIVRPVPGAQPLLDGVLARVARISA